MDRAFGVLFSLQRGTPRHGQWVVECLKGSWDSIVGAKLASVCSPLSLTGAALGIEVHDDAWLPTVRGMRLEMQERICSATRGEVKTLVFSCRSIKNSNPADDD